MFQTGEHPGTQNNVDQPLEHLPCRLCADHRDAPAKLAKFRDKHDLGFTLLSDPDHATAEAYGVWAEKSMYGKKYMGIVRSAFLVDEKGTISHAWPKISPKDTPKNLLKALAEG